MAERLVKLFEFCEKNGGIPAKMRLAMKTGVTQGTAGGTPDSPEMIERFKAAIKEITGKDAVA